MHKRIYLAILLASTIFAACQARAVQTPAISDFLTGFPTLAIAPDTTPSETSPDDHPASPISIAQPAMTPVGTLVSYVLPQMPRDLDTVEIQLSRIPCYGSCPEYAVSIYGDGRVVYSGKQYVGVKGEREYFIPRERVETLVALFYEYGFFSWQDEYSLNVTDDPAYSISIRIGDFVKTVIVYRPGAGPELFLGLADAIDELSGARELVGG